ncbi:MAG: low temperature requirement protein A, partial [Beijerinckiaceae bacterium]
MADKSLIDLRRAEGRHHKVTSVELFFDLVFVFAITQLSHALLADVSIANALRLTLVLLAVWWVWMYTTWVTNWLDPDYVPVRIMLFVLMLAGLVMSAAIPKAFGDLGLIFGAAYAAMQVGRAAFALWAFWRHDAGQRHNFQRILIWLVASAILWIAGGLAEGQTRVLIWVTALGIEFLAPVAGFYTPVLGRSQTSDWNVSSEHMAERCGLFVIIALGESILVTGATFAGLEWKPTTISAFGVAFIGSVAMWWIYFNAGAEEATHHFAQASDPGSMARLAYTYLHIPIVAGIVVTAVGDELSLAHPYGHTDMKTAATLIGGPALFILGNILFKHATAGR